MGAIIKKKGPSNHQCQTPGVKFESESKSLKIIKNQEIRKTKNYKEEPRKIKKEPRKKCTRWHTQTDRHGDSLTELAHCGRFSQNIFSKSLRCHIYDSCEMFQKYTKYGMA